MALFVYRKLIPYMRMRNHPVALDEWYLVGLFVYFHYVCEQRRLWRDCADASPTKKLDKTYQYSLTGYLRKVSPEVMAFECAASKQARAHRGSCCSIVSVLVLLLRTHLNVESWFICLLFCCIDKLEVHDADHNLRLWTSRRRLWRRKTGLSPTSVVYCWPSHGCAYVVIYSSCQCSSAFCLSEVVFSLFRIVWSVFTWCRLNGLCSFPAWCLGHVYKVTSCKEFLHCLAAVFRVFNRMISRAHRHHSWIYIKKSI